MVNHGQKLDIVKLHLEGFSKFSIKNKILEKYGISVTYGLIKRLITKFNTHGTIDDRRKLNKGCKIHRRHIRNDIRVEESVNGENSKKGSRAIARELGISHSTVVRRLKKKGYHSYKIQTHQELREGDGFRRSEFCQSMMEEVHRDESLLKRILFTDECTFTLHNKPNVQTCRQWSKNNPHLLHEGRTQYPEKVNVWAGVIDDYIIGPFFIEDTLTGPKFLELLQNNIVPQLRALPIDFNRIIFQMDGCPAHKSRIVKEYLTQTFPGRVIGPSQNYFLRWPARSPDLSLNDFFLWGTLKQKIYRGRKCANIEELKQRINHFCNSFDRQVFANNREEFFNRLTYCLANYGWHFEHLT